MKLIYKYLIKNIVVYFKYMSYEYIAPYLFLHIVSM